MSDFVDLTNRDSGVLETESDCIDWEIAGVFLSAEPLLFRSRDQSPVNYQSGRRIHPLCDAVLALFQARPLGLLKRHGIL
jgi:hypothetical protein